MVEKVNGGGFLVKEQAKLLQEEADCSDNVLSPLLHQVVLICPATQVRRQMFILIQTGQGLWLRVLRVWVEVDSIESELQRSS